MPQAYRLSLFVAAALMGGCIGDNSNTTPAPRQLQSVTVTDAQGQVTAVSRFDYVGNSLVRVRAYDQPGADGIVGTEDDPLAGSGNADPDGLLAGGGYTTCDVTPADGNPLHDPFVEYAGDNRLQRLFTVLADCTLPGQSASRVTSTYLTSPGTDGEWFTADDVASRQVTLVRTADGSELQQSLLASPDASGTAPADTGLDNITYNPDAGQATATTTPIRYGHDGQGRITTLQSAAYTQTFTYAEDGSLALSGLVLPLATEPDPNIILALYPPATRYREEYQRLDERRTAVESFSLVEKAAYDSLAASPTGQILLALLGLVPDGEVTLDGQVFARLAAGHYVVDREGNVETVTRLGGSGPDGERYTADDEVVATATLRFSR